MREFAIDKRLRNDANHFAATVNDAIGNRSHQPHASAAIDKTDPPPDECAPGATRRIRIRWTNARARSAEYANPLHAVYHGRPDHFAMRPSGPTAQPAAIPRTKLTAS